MAELRLVRNDSSIDWRRLRPTRPIEPGSPEYAWRPDAWNSGPRIAALIEGDMGPLAVTGPPGSGKTTELAAATEHLQKRAVPIYFSVERLAERHSGRVATALLHHVTKRLGEKQFEPSAELRAALSGERSTGSGEARDTVELLRKVIREARSRLHKRVTLIVDGLEKLDVNDARSLGLTLRPLAREAGLVLVVAPSALIGPEATELVHSYRIVRVGAVPILLEFSGNAPMDAWKFLSAMALQRLGLNGWPDNLDRYAYKAALCSGGLPKQFLHFLNDAISFSFVAQHRRLTRGDMRVTYRQNHEASIGLLRDGDLPALERVRGTNGAEMPLEARRRLLDLGFLLEYDSDGKTIVQPHPILTEYTLSPNVDGAFL